MLEFLIRKNCDTAVLIVIVIVTVGRVIRCHQYNQKKKKIQTVVSLCHYFPFFSFIWSVELGRLCFSASQSISSLLTPTPMYNTSNEADAKADTQFGIVVNSSLGSSHTLHPDIVIANWTLEST